ncbi:MAG: zf-HC2 domain-containing protein [Treponema sp.]|jgi:anti-sigma factor RsiW|nr:zf-HC2 domain-containing protein [Treponema sp.]
MCPDPQLLSVYFDGEMTAPWKGKLEKHLDQCSRCRARLESFRRYSPAMLEAAADDSAAGDSRAAAAQERVWRNLETFQRRTAGRSAAPNRVWRRSVSIPLPALAAAAAVLIIALVNFWLRRPVEPSAAPDMTLAADAELDTPGIIPVSDMDSVLQYLSGRDSGDILVLRLPESRNFISSGQPAIIKAADYSRTGPGRRKPR